MTAYAFYRSDYNPVSQYFRVYMAPQDAHEQAVALSCKQIDDYPNRARVNPDDAIANFAKRVMNSGNALVAVENIDDYNYDSGTFSSPSSGIDGCADGEHDGLAPALKGLPRRTQR